MARPRAATEAVPVVVVAVFLAELAVQLLVAIPVDFVERAAEICQQMLQQLEQIASTIELDMLLVDNVAADLDNQDL
jgi:hypothetical protein